MTNNLVSSQINDKGREEEGVSVDSRERDLIAVSTNQNEQTFFWILTLNNTLGEKRVTFMEQLAT